ncbi:MAG TPA: DNA polymerase III subunit epsilon [Xanthomonadales bacterium]|nr:DNA polymerase III subunit epsilon [Xanthomonadales bacterium]
MRQVVLDTETTGLDPSEGHRVIEIGAVELLDRRLSGKNFHSYINPQREIEDGALEVHGITREFLHDKPVFTDVADDFLDFIRGAELIIHNAPFDLGFLDMELSRIEPHPGRVADFATVLDTLELARDMHPGQRNNLDALCKRYEVDNSSRTLHGALLDAEILADVYLAMTGGQSDLGLSFKTPGVKSEASQTIDLAARPPFRVLSASEQELSLHTVRLAKIREQAGHCLWLDLE